MWYWFFFSTYKMAYTFLNISIDAITEKRLDATNLYLWTYGRIDAWIDIVTSADL